MVRFSVEYRNGTTHEFYKFLEDRYGRALIRHDDTECRWILASSSMSFNYSGVIRFKNLEDAIDFKLASGWAA